MRAYGDDTKELFVPSLRDSAVSTRPTQSFRAGLRTWHRVSAKHLQAYLDEMCFRFDNQKNPFLFRDTLLRLLQTEHLEYKELIAA